MRAAPPRAGAAGCDAWRRSYDRSVTVFSADGRLMQVEYAMEAVRKVSGRRGRDPRRAPRLTRGATQGAAVVGVRGEDCVVLAVERRATAKLQDPRTVRKVIEVDDNITLAFAGLVADARVLIDRARVEAQSYRLTLDDTPSVEYMARFIATVQQRYTTRGGTRPFGICTLLAGFDTDGKPRLFQTDPSGTHSEWKAHATGQKNKSLREFLEKNWTAGLSQDDAKMLAVRTLLEVVQSGSKSMELVLITADGRKTVPDEEIDAAVSTVEAERAAARASASAASDE